MGAVIAFAPPPRRRRRPDAVLDAGDRTGEILLFIGVRYERHADAPPVAGSGRERPPRGTRSA
jgi:hypothetical protein